MSEISNNQHYACYYPYTGRITGQTTNLKYWIQVPDETLVGPRPDDGWPLVIQCPGSGYYHGAKKVYPDSTKELAVLGLPFSSSNRKVKVIKV